MRTLLSSFLLLSSLSLSAATFQVTTIADSGPGSLRQAMLDANSQCSGADLCRINFAIPGPVPESGWFTIAPQSPLPMIERSQVMLDATTQKALTGDTNPLGPEIELDGTNAGYRSGIKAFAAYGFVVQGLAVNRFQGHGIFVEGSGSATVTANYVGVDPTGTVAMPNGFDGVAFRNVFTSRIDHNVISGNRANGVYVTGGNNCSIYGNRVGLAASGDRAIPNGASGIDANGVQVYVSDNTVAYNTLHGIAFSGEVLIYGNSVFDNGLLAVANWEGASAPVPAEPPVLTSAVENSRTSGYYTGFPVVEGRIHSAPNVNVVVAAYATPYLNASGGADGRLYIGRTTVHTDEQGNATFKVEREYFNETLEIFGGYATATAQPAGGPVSPFSAPIAITVTTPQFMVTTTADAGPGSLRDAIARVNQASCTIDLPCRIAFDIPAAMLTDGAARITLQSPLPPIHGYVRLSGASQAWWRGDSNPEGPEVEIRGGNGLQFGTPDAPVDRAYIHGIVINGSQGDGLTLYSSSKDPATYSQARVMIAEIYSGTDVRGTTAVPNAGNGVVIAGGTGSSFLFATNTRLSRSVISGNAGHGVVLRGDMHVITTNSIGSDGSGMRAIPNGGDGIHVDAGTRLSLNDNTIAFNRGNGVATSPGVRAPSVLSSIHDNGLLGIDVNSDGVSTADGSNEDGTIDPPVVRSVRYDAAAGVTVIEGTSHPAAYPMSPPFGGVGDAFATVLFMSSAPDPSGRGEGERYIAYTYPPVKFVEGGQGSFRIGILGDFRGKWFTATTNRFYCYWEAGCTSRESSEFGVAVKGE